ncbi:MAG: hypothetical protein ACK4OP_00140 [Gemmobacter sp.]
MARMRIAIPVGAVVPLSRSGASPEAVAYCVVAVRGGGTVYLLATATATPPIFEAMLRDGTPYQQGRGDRITLADDFPGAVVDFGYLWAATDGDHAEVIADHA